VELERSGLEVELERKPVSELARTSVAAGLSVEALIPLTPGLEALYLTTLDAHRSGTLAPLARELAAPTPQAAGVPAKRLAPPRPILAAARHEISNATRQPFAVLLLVLPCVLAAVAVLRRRADAVQEAAAVGVDLISATAVNAFEGVVVALRAGLPLAVMILAGMASQSIAGEFSRGTLRNLLLVPLGRRALVLGKALAWASLALASWVALAATSLGVAAWAFDFGDVVEIMPNGQAFPLIPAEELWPMLRTALVAPFLPLTACVLLGFLAGALWRGAAGAMAAAGAGRIVLDVARAPARGYGLEYLLPTTYLPSPLGDRSCLRSFLDAAQGSMDASFPLASSQWIVPVLWLILAPVVALLVWRRRSVP
jgi:hypothetical protein